MKQHEKIQARKKLRVEWWLEAKALATKESERHGRSFSKPPGSSNPKKLKGVRAKGE